MQSSPFFKFTWAKLAGAAVMLSVLSIAPSAIAQTYQLGDSGYPVNLIQQRLGITPDGIFGSDTQTAVLQFQQERGLAADGVVGEDTIRELGLEDELLGSRSYNPETAASNRCTSGSTPYVVVVPSSSLTAFNTVTGNRYQTAADQCRNGRGSYIRVGLFPRRSQAEALSRELRREYDVDARVAYRP